MDWIFFHFRQSFRTDDSVFAKTAKLPKQLRFIENRLPAETSVGRIYIEKRYYETITTNTSQPVEPTELAVVIASMATRRARARGREEYLYKSDSVFIEVRISSLYLHLRLSADRPLWVPKMPSESFRPEFHQID